MSDQIVSWVRTVVPAAIAAGLTLLAKHTGVVVDDDTSQALTLGVVGVVLAVYYPAVRWAERRVPAVGWLLGVAKAPTYAPTVALTGHVDPGPTVYTHAQIAAAIDRSGGDLRRFQAILDKRA